MKGIEPSAVQRQAALDAVTERGWSRTSAAGHAWKLGAVRALRREDQSRALAALLHGGPVRWTDALDMQHVQAEAG